MNNLKITKGDSKESRHSKRKAANKIKRKNKHYQSEVSKYQHVKRGKFHSTKRKTVRFSRSIEDFCNANMSLSQKSNKLVVKLNKDFSLFDNPSKVLLSLIDLLKHAKTLSVNSKWVFDGHVSFGALYLLDNLSWEIGKKRKWVIEKRNFPPEEASILSNLKSMVSSTYIDENEHMINERVVINREDPLAKQQYKAIAKTITDMIEEAIRENCNDVNYDLPLEIHGAIKSTIGESFDNIHLHSEITEVGTLCGFYNKISQEVTLLIYNFGRTIAETFSMEDVPNDVKNDIAQVIANHTANKYLNIFTGAGDFTKENALTLLAIQEGISSKMKVDFSRGHGIIDFVEHCFQLSDKCKIAIISGKTAIKIDNRYPMSSQYFLGRERRIMAFNDDNDLFKKPDSKHIINTGVHFNGVIIEATIPLNLINHD